MTATERHSQPSFLPEKAEYPMPINWDKLIPPPTDDHRAAKRADLVSRARSVQQNGWEPYQYTWSRGEALAVAVLLDSTVVLDEFGETRDSVFGRWAYDLFGHSGGQEEEATGYPRTRKWFMVTQTDLANS